MSTTYFSTRIRKDKLNTETINAINKNIEDFNKVFRQTMSFSVKHDRIIANVRKYQESLEVDSDNKSTKNKKSKKSKKKVEKFKDIKLDERLSKEDYMKFLSENLDLNETIDLYDKLRKEGVNNYYAREISAKVGAQKSSLDELRKLHISQVEKDIAGLNGKIGSTKARKTVLQNIKDSLKRKEIPQFNGSGEFIYNEDGSVTRVVNRFNKKKSREIKYKNLYDFEVQYLREQQKRLKQKLSQLKLRLNRLNQELAILNDENFIKSCVFGLKANFIKITKEENVEKRLRMLKKIRHHRNKSFSISGSREAKNGNYVFEYDPSHFELKIKLMEQEEALCKNGKPKTGFKIITLKNIKFPYGQMEIDKYFKTQTSDKTDKKAKGVFIPGVGKVRTSDAKPIAFSLEDHEKYYIIKCTLDSDESEFDPKDYLVNKTFTSKQIEANKLNEAKKEKFNEAKKALVDAGAVKKKDNIIIEGWEENFENNQKTLNKLNKFMKTFTNYRALKPISFYDIHKSLQKYRKLEKGLIENGIIGLDMNLEHFAVVNINKDGNCIDFTTINFKALGLSKAQIKLNIEKAAIEFIDYVISQGKKAIAIERLNTTLSKSGKRYNNKRNNYTINMFAYRQMTNAIKSRARKLGIKVYEVNPVATSIIGRYKYMYKFKCPVHNAAAYVIGRRAMGFEEKIPNYIKKLELKYKKKPATNIAEWLEINRQIKAMGDEFYKKIANSNPNRDKFKRKKNELDTKALTNNAYKIGNEVCVNDKSKIIMQKNVLNSTKILNNVNIT